MTEETQKPPFYINPWPRNVLVIGAFDVHCTEDAVARRALSALIRAVHAPITLATLAFGDGLYINENADALAAILKRLGFRSLAPEQNHEESEVVLFWRLQHCRRIQISRKLIARFDYWREAFNALDTGELPDTFCCGLDIHMDDRPLPLTRAALTAPIVVYARTNKAAFKRSRYLGQRDNIFYYAAKRSDF